MEIEGLCGIDQASARVTGNGSIDEQQMTDGNKGLDVHAVWDPVWNPAFEKHSVPEW